MFLTLSSRGRYFLTAHVLCSCFILAPSILSTLVLSRTHQDYQSDDATRFNFQYLVSKLFISIRKLFKTLSGLIQPEPPTAAKTHPFPPSASSPPAAVSGLALAITSTFHSKAPFNASIFVANFSVTFVPVIALATAAVQISFVS